MIAEAGDLLKASNMGMAHIAPIGFPSFAEPARGAGGRRSECYPVSNPRAQNQEAGGDGYAPLGVIIMIDR